MPITLGNPHSRRGVAILSRREVCSCPNCRAFVLAVRGLNPPHEAFVLDPPFAAWLTIRLMYPSGSKRFGYDRVNPGEPHKCLHFHHRS